MSSLAFAYIKENIYSEISEKNLIVHKTIDLHHIYLLQLFIVTPWPLFKKISEKYYYLQHN